MSVNLDALKKKGKASKAKPALPVFEATDEQKKQADKLAELFEKEKSAKASKETIQADFKDATRRFIFETNSGRSTLQATISVAGAQSEILIALKDAYSSVPFDDVKLIIGEARAREFFRQRFEIKLDSNLIPEDSQQAVIDKIVGVLTEYGCLEAISVKEGYKPTKAFATERHHKLSVEENMQLEALNDGLTTMSVSPARGRKAA